MSWPEALVTVTKYLVIGIVVICMFGDIHINLGKKNDNLEKKNDNLEKKNE